MNINTGEIIENSALKELFFEKQQEFVQVNEEDMTPKQKLTKQVSLHDNRSRLGKLRVKSKNNLNFTKSIKKQRKNERQRRRANRK